MGLWDIIFIGIGTTVLSYLVGCIAAYYFHRWIGLATTTLFDYIFKPWE